MGDRAERWSRREQTGGDVAGGGEAPSRRASAVPSRPQIHQIGMLHRRGAAPSRAADAEATSATAKNRETDQNEEIDRTLGSGAWRRCGWHDPASRRLHGIHAVWRLVGPRGEGSSASSSVTVRQPSAAAPTSCSAALLQPGSCSGGGAPGGEQCGLLEERSF